MSDPVFAALFIAGAYLTGSIPFGLLLGRRRGVDVRAVGSGNIGAANVARSLGKKLGVVVLLLDLLKGAGPLLLLSYLGPTPPAYPYLITAVGVAAISGHCFSVWLRFRGGKGVSTALGVFLTLSPGITAIGMGVFAVLYGLSRRVSLGSIGGAVTIAALLWALGRPGPEAALGAASAAIIIIQHRSNIRRLIRREELGI